MWGAGHSHTMVRAHLLSGGGLLFGRGVGVSPAWGSLTERKDLNNTRTGWWTWRDGRARALAMDVWDLGLCTLPAGG